MRFDLFLVDGLSILFPNSPATAGQAVWEKDISEAELLGVAFPIPKVRKDSFGGSLRDEDVGNEITCDTETR